MISLKDYSLNLPEEEYHKYPAWSYSLIARYAKDGFSAIATLHEPVTPTPSMEFGSLFDSFITKGKATLKEYAVSTVSVPDAEKKALDYLSTLTDERFENLDPGWIYDRTQECGYQTRLKMDTKYNKLKEYAEYFNLKKSGKKIVSQQDWQDAVDMYNIFRTSENTKELFGTQDTEDIEYIYQAQFKVPYRTDSGKDIEIKVMPDLMVVNHKDKTIQLVDLKTSSVPGWSFAENFIKFRYDIQAQLYSDVVSIIISHNSDYVDYTILPYIFADISRSDKIPVTYVYNQYDDSQSEGLSFKGYQYKNYRQLLEEILDYEEKQAKVPNYIKLDEPNDLISILNNR